MQPTNIEWTDFTWNPITGCTKISAGCKNCYAASMTKRFEKKWGPFSKVTSHLDRLNEPKRRRKSAKIFVCSMSDLFHQDVPFELTDAVYKVMEDCSTKHTFQILTKRPARMIEYYNSPNSAALKYGYPLRNIWIGVSVETQGRADERIPLLLEVPARVRFLSVEPLLNYMDLSRYLATGKIDWVIVGGETGRGARVMDLNWARAVREQCRAFNVPFFFKQTGGRPNLPTLDGIVYNEFPKE